MATAIGTYSTRALVKARLDSGTSYTAADDSLIDSFCDQINQFIESKTGRVLAPVASAQYIFNGTGKRKLYVPNGIRAITLLEVAPYTGAAYETITATNYYLGPATVNREPGWPASYVEFSDVVSSAYDYFPAGFDTIRITMTTGPAAMPDDIIELAVTAVIRAWHRRMAGQADLVGTNEYGQPLVSRFLERRDYDLLDYYSGRQRIS